MVPNIGVEVNNNLKSKTMSGQNFIEKHERAVFIVVGFFAIVGLVSFLYQIFTFIF